MEMNKHKFRKLYPSTQYLLSIKMSVKLRASSPGCVKENASLSMRTSILNMAILAAAPTARYAAWSKVPCGAYMWCVALTDQEHQDTLGRWI